MDRMKVRLDCQNDEHGGASTEGIDGGLMNPGRLKEKAAGMHHTLF